LNIWTFWGQKNSLTCSKNKSSFFTQEWFKLGLDCHATGLCTLDLFKISIISVWYVDMMVQHAWWIMSKLTNTKSKLCPYHGDPCTKLKHVVHPWKGNYSVLPLKTLLFTRGSSFSHMTDCTAPRIIMNAIL